MNLHPEYGHPISRRADAAEARLAKSVQLIDDMLLDHDAEGCGCEPCLSHLKRRAELTGGKDE